ncbi:hypothetical protein DSECCO2_442940 [anaerobic digester metagenome]
MVPPQRRRIIEIQSLKPQFHQPKPRNTANAGNGEEPDRASCRMSRKALQRGDRDSSRSSPPLVFGFVNGALLKPPQEKHRLRPGHGFRGGLHTSHLRCSRSLCSRLEASRLFVLRSSGTSHLAPPVLKLRSYGSVVLRCSSSHPLAGRITIGGPGHQTVHLMPD